MDPNQKQSALGESQQEVDEYVALVNFSIRLRELIDEGFTEVWLVNPESKEVRQVIILQNRL